ncbi:uncharacterized protein LOC117830403 [Notolabrus celidotus]|uniref:uncharacterized protein LOC117830403 n=1 Tax=Notolabrus celidotus TaxID=1203425 RepID=UPI00148F7979|nr:uncharacterized protein LOC117830403 [Notolabrus celidotus]
MLNSFKIELHCMTCFSFCLYPAASAPNVAPTGTASQSSTYSSQSPRTRTLLVANASLAIDGNKNPEHFGGSCTHTLEGDTHWWSLLLPAVYRITHISITNRMLITQRINDAQILIGTSTDNNGNNNPRCDGVYGINPGATRTFNCGGMIGQMVTVNLKGSYGALSMCELEVYGEMAAPSFSAVVMGRSVEVVEKKLCWSDALFYCRDFYWDLLSIRSEEEQREVEEVLKSVSFPLTERVWLGLRRDLMGDTWFWMSGDSMDFNDLKTQSTWDNTSPCGAMDSSDGFHWGDRPCGEHLHFVCLKDIQRDNKRLEFYSSSRP